MRKPRLILNGSKYHVTAQVNRKEFILNSPKIKKLFLEIIKRAKTKYIFSISNFCIMGNHIHLLIQPLKGEKLSKIMQWILATFAINYNKLFNLTGHVWYDRFHSTIISSFYQFLKTFDYISQNPVKAKLVKIAEDYKYGGMYHLQKGLFHIITLPEGTEVY